MILFKVNKEGKLKVKTTTCKKMAGRAGRDNGIQSVSCLLGSSSLKILKAFLNIRDFFLTTKIINF